LTWDLDFFKSAGALESVLGRLVFQSGDNRGLYWIMVSDREAEAKVDVSLLLSGNDTVGFVEGREQQVIEEWARNDPLKVSMKAFRVSFQG
jgi:hypothetical protein